MSLTSSDQALLLAVASWGGSITPQFWSSFQTSWRARLQPAWEALPATVPEGATAALRRAHAAQVRPDPARVHPSWPLRGLREESPAVQRAVIAGASDHWRAVLRNGLNLAESDLATDRPPHPEALSCARSLWTERLVGDVPERIDDPPALRALTRLDPRTLVRLVHTAGLAKWSLATTASPRLNSRRADRLEAFRTYFRAAEGRFRQLAQRDVGALGEARRHAEVRLGLTTIGRLLSMAEPYRVRWALQHLPYPAAKVLRSLMPAPTGGSKVWFAWETDILRAAWTRLKTEGRMTEAWGEPS